MRLPPLQRSYRWMRVLPMYRSPCRYSEDPREWVESEFESGKHLLKGWRSLRRAQRKAVGTVIYSRQAFRMPEPRAKQLWSNVIAVSYRASLRDPWVVDWSAMALAEAWRSRREEYYWEYEELGEHDRRFLEVMRVVQGQRRRHDRHFGEWAGKFLPGPHWATRRVDEAWIRACPVEKGEAPRYEVSLGSWPEADLLIRTYDFKEALDIAQAALDEARRALARALLDAGGLGAELSARPDRWPEPRVHTVPVVYDEPIIERLRKVYEQLLEERNREKEEGTDDD